jgi:hypothetical protein
MTCCFVIGGAKDIWDDLHEARARYGDHDVIAVNDIGMEYRGNLAAWVSLHGEKLVHWMRHRANAGLPPAKKTYTGLSAGDWKNVREGVDECVRVLWPEQEHCGSSGLFAVRIALEYLNYDTVILCGIPMTSTGQHYFRSKDWGVASVYWPHWEAVYESRLKGKVFSMSGWTRNLLGEPPTSLMEIQCPNHIM